MTFQVEYSSFFFQISFYTIIRINCKHGASTDVRPTHDDDFSNLYSAEDESEPCGSACDIVTLSVIIQINYVVKE